MHNEPVDQDSAGFVPSKEILKKVKRRCIREMEYESDDRVEFWARKFDYRLGSQNRRDLLFNLEYSTDFAWLVSFDELNVFSNKYS